MEIRTNLIIDTVDFRDTVDKQLIFGNSVHFYFRFVWIGSNISTHLNMELEKKVLV